MFFTSPPNACLWTRVARPHACTSALALLVLVAALVAAAPRSAFSQGGSQAGARTFDDLTVERIKPDDIPDQASPGAPIGLRTPADKLPKAPTEQDLRRAGQRVASATVRLVAVKTPPRPFRQEPSLSFGHAVRVALEPSSPQAIWLTTLAWLADADRVFVIHGAATESEKTPDWMRARRVPLESITAGAAGQAWLDQHADALEPIELLNPDPHRNLVSLRSDKLTARSDPPLALFAYDSEALFFAHGYSPFFGEVLAQTTITPTHPDNPALAFYFQTTFPAVSGAPIVSSDARLVTLTAFRHPDQADLTLAIPTGAIAHYMGAHLAPDQGPSR